MAQFNFKLNIEEYLELVAFQFENLRSLRTLRIWLRLSVPLLVLLLVLFFKIYSDYDLLIILILFLGLWFLSYPRIWGAVIKNKISRKKVGILNKVKFENTYVEIELDQIHVKSESFEKNYYLKNLEHIVLKDKVLLMFIEKDVICLPRRLFDNSNPIELITSLTKKVGQSQHK